MPDDPLRDGVDLSSADYRRLADLRHALRTFLHWSAQRARDAGVTPAQHQLLLAIRAFEGPHGPTIGAMADVLLIRHHSAVELVDRAQRAGLIRRARDAEQRALVRLALTDHGAATLRSLSRAHERELTQLGPTMRALLDAIGQPPDP